VHTQAFKKRIYVMLCTLVHIGDKEDNHYQEEGRAKSAWMETRILGGNWIVVHCLVHHKLRCLASSSSFLSPSITLISYPDF
jgi:hypothetical protein